MSTAASPVTQTRTKFVPAFLAKLGVEPGGWGYYSKLTLRAMMRPSWPLKVRIWACLIAQSFGYEADLAVIMRKANRPGGLPTITPLLPHEIIHALGAATAEACRDSHVKLTDEQQQEIAVSRQHMRRALAEMEDQDGLIVRVRCNRFGPAPKPHESDTRPFWNLAGLSLDEAIAKCAVTPLANLTAVEARKVQRKICVYVHAKPKPAKNLVAEIGYIRDAKSNGSNGLGVGDSPYQRLLPFLSKGDRHFASQLAQRPEVAAWLDAGRQLIEKAVQEVKASSITGRKPGETGSVPNPILRAEPPNTRHSAPPVHEAASSETAHSNPRPVTPNGQAASPVSAVANPKRSGRLDEQTPADEDQRTQRPVAPAIAESISQADVSQVHLIMRRWCPFGCDKDAARKLIRACRGYSANATAAAIIEAVDLRGPRAKTRGAMAPGFLITAVPKLFEGWRPPAEAKRKPQGEWKPLTAAELADLEKA